MPQNKWFDAFFEALTSSPEYKSVMREKSKTPKKELSLEDIANDMSKINSDLEKTTKELNKTFDNQDKASDIYKSLWESLSSSESKKAWESLTTKKQDKKEEEQKSEIELNIEYPKSPNPLTKGFLWIAWMKDLKEELQESFINPIKFKFFIEELKNKDSWSDEKTKLYLELYEKYEKFWVWIPTWVMFYGPPWTWKTFITKKLAEELECWIIIKTVWEFGSSYMHQTSKNIRDFFAKAKKAAESEPIILFLDEIDSLLSKRTDRVDSNKAEEISQFLQEINDLKKAQNLILIWATNRPDHLDSAIMRSGRFDKKVYIWPPDNKARKELFKIFIEKTNRPHDKLDYAKLALLTDWYVSADIEVICNEAARHASKSILDIMTQLKNDFENGDIEALKDDIHKNVINMELLEKSIKNTTSSLKMVDMSVYDDWIKDISN